MSISQQVKEYKKRLEGQRQFIDQNRKVTHGQGIIKEKYWFSPEGEIVPVEHEHGDQMLTLARDSGKILPDKAITDYGYKSKWELANGMFLQKGWLRVQVYDEKSVGLNGKPVYLEKTSTQKAARKVLKNPKEYFFQENWPYTLQYNVSAQDIKKLGWKGAIQAARAQAKLELKKDLEPS
jgi:hypothetical protein